MDRRVSGSDQPPPTAHLLAATLVVLAVVVVVSAVTFPLMFRVYRAQQQRNQQQASERGDESRPMGEASAVAEEARRWGSSRWSGESSPGAEVAVPLLVGDSRLAFGAAFAYGVNELPFKPSQVTHSFVSFDLGISIAGDVDYLLIFLVEPLASHYQETGWPEADALLESVTPAEVLGLIENVGQRLAVFTDTDEVAAELVRLRVSIAGMPGSASSQ